LIDLIRTYLKKPFIRVSLWTGIATFIKMCTGFVTLKLLAIYTGATGVALFGQLNNAVTVLTILASGGINTGVTKYLAEFGEDKKMQSYVISVAFKITIVCSILIGGIILFGASWLGQFLFNSNQYDYILVIFSLTIVFYALNNLILSIINGFKSYKQFVLINMISSLVMMIFTIGAIYFWEQDGVLVAYVTSQSLAILITIALVKNPFKTEAIRLPFDKKVALMLLAFSSSALVTAIINPLAQLATRQLISSIISIRDAGIWEGLNRISSVYLMLILSSIQVYYLPRLAEIKSKVELVTEIRKTMWLVLPPLAIGILGIFLLRDVVISILFTEDFRVMRDLFAVQLVGDFVRIVSQLMSFVMPARGLVKPLIVTEIIFNFSYVGFSYLFISLGGFDAIPWAYLVNYSIYSIVVFLILRAYVKK
jgi:O-antigen/teichoic acid export membrane protein